MMAAGQQRDLSAYAWLGERLINEGMKLGNLRVPLATMARRYSQQSDQMLA